MLEKVKSRALRLSLPLKEMKKNASERPSKVYGNVEVLRSSTLTGLRLKTLILMLRELDVFS